MSDGGGKGGGDQSAPDIFGSYSPPDTGFLPPESSGDVSSTPGWSPDFGDSGGSASDSAPSYFSNYTPGGDTASFGGPSAAAGVSSIGGSENGLDAISSALGYTPTGSSASAFAAPTGVAGGSPDLTSAFNEDDKVPLPTSRPPQADAVLNPGGVGDEFGTGNSFLSDKEFADWGNQYPAAPDTSLPPNDKTAGFTPPSGITPSNTSNDASINASADRGGGKVSATVPLNSDGSSTDGKGIWDKLLGGAQNSIAANPLGTAIAGGGLLYNISQGKKVAGGANAAGLKSTIPEVQKLISGIKEQSDALASNVAPLNAQSKELMSYVTNGQLPPGYQAQVDAGTKAAKTRLMSTYASRGQSTDPTRNSTLAQELNQIDSQSTVLSQTLAKQLYDAGVAGSNLANQTQQASTNMLQTGLNGIGIDRQTYESLIKIDQENSKQTGDAIQNFAAALAGAGTTKEKSSEKSSAK